VETIALVCKAGELIGLLLAVSIGWPHRLAAWSDASRAPARYARFARRG
jgi:hypothetical protein